MAIDDLTDKPELRALLASTLAGQPARGAVLCLCAQWCGTCRDYRAAFEAAASAHAHLAFRWVDIEDEADALGDVDIDTFPTLIIGSASGAIVFAGPVLPQAAQVDRLIQRLQL